MSAAAAALPSPSRVHWLAVGLGMLAGTEHTEIGEIRGHFSPPRVVPHDTRAELWASDGHTAVLTIT